MAIKHMVSASPFFGRLLTEKFLAVCYGIRMLILVLTRSTQLAIAIGVLLQGSLLRYDVRCSCGVVDFCFHTYISLPLAAEMSHSSPGERAIPNMVL